jgi:hypothetical protein
MAEADDIRAFKVLTRARKLFKAEHPREEWPSSPKAGGDTEDHRRRHIISRMLRNNFWPKARSRVCDLVQ